MADLNRLEIMGRLTQDVELQYSGKGTAYCRLNIAATRKYILHSGEKKEETYYCSAAVFDQRAEYCAKYMKKGSLVFLEGHLANDNKEVDGKKTYNVRVQVDNIQLLAGGVSPDKAPVGKTSSSSYKISGDIPF